jgi:hypothetical protein
MTIQPPLRCTTTTPIAEAVIGALSRSSQIVYMVRFFFTVVLLGVLSLQAAHATCEDQLRLLEEHVKKHPREGDAAQVQKNLKSARADVDVDEVGCLNAVARARRALAAPTPPATPTPKDEPVGRYQSPEQERVQPLDQPSASPTR